MRTVDFSTVLFEALQIAGQDRQNIQRDTFAQFRDFANNRMRYLWDAFEWPEAVRYASAQVQKEDGVTYINAPALSEEILHVYSANPLTTTSVKEYSFNIYYPNTTNPQRRLALLSEPEGDVCVVFKIAKPVFCGDIWTSSVQYNSGDQVYYDPGAKLESVVTQSNKTSAGNFYIRNNSAGPNNDNPITGYLYWSKVQIPYFASSYLPRAIYADWLRSEMQMDLAQAAEQDAEFALTEEIGKITRVQGQTQRFNFINTY